MIVDSSALIALIQNEPAAERVAAVLAGARRPVIGAATLQWPLGWLSDRIDRRLVMVGSGTLGAAAALALAEYGSQSELYLLALGALFGAFIIPMFGLTAAHANDHAAPGAAVQTNGGLLLLHGCGSVVGATLGGLVMSSFGPGAVFNYIAIVYIVLMAFCLYRIMARASAPPGAKMPFVPVPRSAAPTVFEIAEEDENEEAEEPAEAAP